MLLWKGLAVGIILLFVAIACSPAISAHDDTIISKTSSIPEKENTVSIMVLEYKSDGTIGKSTVKLSKLQAENLRGELNNVKDIDTRLSIYKKYNLIPQDVSVEKLRLGMEERAQKLGLTNEKLEQLASSSVKVEEQKNKNPFLEIININLKCSVEVDTEWPIVFVIPIGLSFFTRFLNTYLRMLHISLLPSIDLSDRFIGLFDSVSSTSGQLPSFYLKDFMGLVKLVGFVGYAVFYWIRFVDGYFYFDEFSGFAVYIRTFGI